MPITREDLDGIEEYLDAFVSFDAELLEYEGFSPEYTRRKVMDRSGFKKAAVAICVAAYLKRGTKTQKMMAKMSNNGKHELRSAIAALTLDNGSAKGKDKDFVHLPRLAASFPEVVAFVAAHIGNERWKLIEELPESLSFVGANPGRLDRSKECPLSMDHYVQRND